MIVTRSRARVRDRVAARRASHVEDPASSTAPAAPLLYDQLAAADVNGYLQALLASGADFTPRADGGWSFGDPVSYPPPQFTVGDLFGAGYSLDAGGNAVTVDSPHGGAARLTASVDNGITDPGDFWTQAETTLYAFTDQAWAFVFRARFSAVTAGGDRAFFGRGAGASAHYAGGLDASGQLWIRAKQMGGPATARVAADMRTNAWAWCVVGRSVVDQVMRAAHAGGDASAALSGSANLTNAGAAFVFGDTIGAAGGQLGNVTGELEHWLAFDGTAAENILANRVALIAALEAAEG